MATESEVSGGKLLEVINQARFWTFLAVGVYISITVASTTDEMLVRPSQVVSLPLLNTQIPISGLGGFYSIAPWFVVMLHYYLLLELSLLGIGGKLQRFRTTASTEILQGSGWCARLTDFHYTQFILLWLLLHVILIILPLILLLWIEARFLSYHHSGITWMHRFVLLVDIGLLWWLWPSIVWDYDAAVTKGWLGLRERVRRLPFLGICSVLSLALGLCMAIPGPQDPRLEWPRAWLPQDSLLKGGLEWWFKRRVLDLRDEVLTVNGLTTEIINDLRSDEDISRIEGSLRKVSELSYYQGRNMNHADLSNAVLPKVDFRALRTFSSDRPAQLQGAKFNWATMQRALLDKANLRNAQLNSAWLQEASLHQTKLQGAELLEAHLQLAKFWDANLNGSNLKKAKLQGADLADAHLQVADLSSAQLQGANLHKANLQGANLSGAQLQGADLSEANLQGAILKEVDLTGAILSKSFINKCELYNGEIPISGVTSILGLDSTIDKKPSQEEINSLVGNLRQELAEKLKLELQEPVLEKRIINLHNTSNRWHKTCPPLPQQDENKQIDSLVDLACSDGYIARGLISQITKANSNRLNRLELANALLEKIDNTKQVTINEESSCRGLINLPESIKDELKKLSSPAQTQR